MHLAAALARDEDDPLRDAIAGPLLGDALLAALPRHTPIPLRRRAILGARLFPEDLRFAPASETADRGAHDDVAKRGEAQRKRRVLKALELAGDDLMPLVQDATADRDPGG